MADHSLRAAGYALKAVAQAGMDAEEERRWQERKLPDGIRTLVMQAGDGSRPATQANLGGSRIGSRGGMSKSTPP